MEEEQMKHENWMIEYERTNVMAKLEQMKQHIKEAEMFSQALVDSPMGYPEDYDLLWTTWCIRRSIK